MFEKFAARLSQARWISKKDIAGLVKRVRFWWEVKKMYKKVTWNKTKLVETEKKITDLTSKVAQISEKKHDFVNISVSSKQIS